MTSGPSTLLTFSHASENRARSPLSWEKSFGAKKTAQMRMDKVLRGVELLPNFHTVSQVVKKDGRWIKTQIAEV